MKKSWMIGVMLLGALTTQAQWKITPEAGFNVTKYTNSPAKIGYKVGAAVSYDFGESGFALQSGLYYVQSTISGKADLPCKADYIMCREEKEPFVRDIYMD